MTSKTYKALFSEEINQDGSRNFFIKLGPEVQPGSTKRTSTENSNGRGMVAMDAAPRSYVKEPANAAPDMRTEVAGVDPWIGKPVPGEYWSLKKQQRYKEASQLIGGFGYGTAKNENNKWVIVSRDKNRGTSPGTPKRAFREFSSFKYKYSLPYPGAEGFNVDAVKDKIKKGGGFFNAKAKGGDNCWYSDDVIPEARGYMLPVQPLQPPDSNIHRNDPEAELAARDDGPPPEPVPGLDDFAGDDIPF